MLEEWSSVAEAMGSVQAVWKAICCGSACAPESIVQAFPAMDATQKWLVGVGGAILGALVSVQLYLHNSIRADMASIRDDMAAMEQRLSASISGVAETLRGQDNRLRDVEITSAVNDALARMAVDVSTNRASRVTTDVPPNVEEPPPAS